MQKRIDSIGSAEAASLLGIDRSTLTRWVKANKLTPILRGSGTTGEMFFDRSDLTALTPSPVVTPSAPEADRLAAGEFSSSKDAA